MAGRKRARWDDNGFPEEPRYARVENKRYPVGWATLVRHAPVGEGRFSQVYVEEVDKQYVRWAEDFVGAARAIDSVIFIADDHTIVGWKQVTVTGSLPIEMMIGKDAGALFPKSFSRE